MAEPSPAEEQSPISVPLGLKEGMLVANKYELIRKLGTGAMGEVWAAKHLSLEEEVAIKLVRRDVEHGDGTNAEDRFLLEARVSAALSRKTRHIVNVTDHGEDGPLAYLVMELLNGESLDARLARKGPLSLAQVVPIISQIARGLAVAHSEGIVHRDLKPSNVFVTKDGEGRALVKIVDFGIAKLRASLRKIPLNATPAVQGGAKHATLTGFLLGTPAFMSPEQAKGKSNIDHRADVWALGVMAYHLLTAHYPFDGQTFEELIERLCKVRYTPILKHRPDLPEIVGDFFSRAFATRMNERFQSATAFAAAFEQLEPLSKLTLSLPPPPPAPSLAPAAAEPERVADPGTMVAAGVPTKNSLRWKLGGAALVVAVVVGTTGLLKINFEREPAMQAAKLTAGANITTVTNATTTVDGRDAIPLPDESKATPPPVAAHDLPSVPNMASTPVGKPSVPTISASLPAAPGSPAVASDPPAPTSKSAPPKQVDKSEVF
jgi:eukaryotic-like serine/threonine-protein kinase